MKEGVKEGRREGFQKAADLGSGTPCSLSRVRLSQPAADAIYKQIQILIDLQIIIKSFTKSESQSNPQAQSSS